MKHPRRAESLIESMVAITIIVIASLTAVNLVNASIRGNEVIGEQLIALNLGLEGIEAFKNLRDTNYLLFAANADACWDDYEASSSSNCGSSRDLSETSTYKLERNLDGTSPLLGWELVEVTDTSNDGFMTLYDYNFDPNDATQIMPLYAQSDLEANMSELTPVQTDKYQRLFSIDYQNDDVYNVTVTVNWNHRGNTKTVTLTRSIAHVF